MPVVFSANNHSASKPIISYSVVSQHCDTYKDWLHQDIVADALPSLVE
jgi:hypothetical protein